jgi:hypothetical protein
MRVGSAGWLLPCGFASTPWCRSWVWLANSQTPPACIRRAWSQVISRSRGVGVPP